MRQLRVLAFAAVAAISGVASADSPVVEIHQPGTRIEVRGDDRARLVLLNTPDPVPYKPARLMKTCRDRARVVVRAPDTGVGWPVKLALFGALPFAFGYLATRRIIVIRRRRIIDSL